MKKSVVLYLVILLFLFFYGCKSEKILVISPHPDDETLGAGLILIRNPNVVVIEVTDGEPGNNTEIAEIRKQEVIDAMKLLNTNVKVYFFNYDDNNTVSYLPEIYNSFLNFFQKNTFDRVYVPAYEGGNIDHDIVHFAAVIALKKMNYHGKIFEYHLYNYYNGKVNYDSLSEQNEMVPANVPMEKFYYTDEDLRIKQKMLDIFKSQPIQKRIWVDMTRRLPEFDYTKPPHERPLLYEINQSGIKFENFTIAVNNFYEQLNENN